MLYNPIPTRIDGGLGLDWKSCIIRGFILFNKFVNVYIEFTIIFISSVIKI